MGVDVQEFLKGRVFLWWGYWYPGWVLPSCPLTDSVGCWVSLLLSHTCSTLNYSLALPFFGIGMKTDLFQSCGHCWVFQICWHIECSTFTASSFRIWNSSTGIPSPPLDLFLVMLPKAYLTSHSKMSGSRWVITPLWFSGSGKGQLSFQSQRKAVPKNAQTTAQLHSSSTLAM